MAYLQRQPLDEAAASMVTIAGTWRYAWRADDENGRKDNVLA